MCISPGKLKDGTEIACRKCWQCRENRVNDWVGRCIAESMTAKASHAITLTYGRDQYGSADHPAAVVLTYSDVQKYFKLLRRHGYPCRYIAVGEYGTAKGRAHWHLVVFWLDKVPPHELDVRFEEPHWPHGVSFWTHVNSAATRYNLKYIQKDIGEMERQGHLAMSKKPPLGTVYFMREAERLVEAGLSPRDLLYTFDAARDKQGRKVEFMMRGKTADIYLDHFMDVWHRDRSGQKMPNSPVLEKRLNAGSADPVRGYEKLQPIKLVVKPLRETEVVEPWEWAQAWRFQNPPRRSDMLPWMVYENLWWDHQAGAGAWSHPAREHERHVSGEPWQEHEYAVYYWHPDQWKGGGKWLVVPPQKKAA